MSWLQKGFVLVKGMLGRAGYDEKFTARASGNTIRSLLLRPSSTAEGGSNTKCGVHLENQRKEKKNTEKVPDLDMGMLYLSVAVLQCSRAAG